LKLFLQLGDFSVSYADVAEAACRTGPKQFHKYGKAFRYLISASDSNKYDWINFFYLTISLSNKKDNRQYFYLLNTGMVTKILIYIE